MIKIVEIRDKNMRPFPIHNVAPLSSKVKINLIEGDSILVDGYTSMWEFSKRGITIHNNEEEITIPLWNIAGGIRLVK